MLRADWFETLALATQMRVARARIEREIKSKAGEVDDDHLEELVEDTLSEIRRRRLVSGLAYPFSVTRFGIEPESDHPLRTEYAFLALLSVHRPFRKRDYDNGFWPDREFERLTAHSLRRWWSDGESFVFADLGKGFAHALRSVGKLVGCACFPEKARPERKDHGLDVITFLRFADRTGGFPILLSQCTITEKGLPKKARDVVPSEWAGLLEVPQLAFKRSLAVPHVISPGEPTWWELTAKYRPDS